MGNVYHLPPASDSGVSGGEPPMPPSTDERLTGIEGRVTHIEAVMPTLATKADMQEVRAEMHGMKADLIKWIVGTAIALGATGITVMTFVLNNAAPKAPPAVQQQQPPIIINIPAAPTTQSTKP